MTAEPPPTVEPLTQDSSADPAPAAMTVEQPPTVEPLTQDSSAAPAPTAERPDANRTEC